MGIRAYLNGFYYVFIGIGFILTYHWILDQQFYTPPSLSLIKEMWDLGIAESPSNADQEDS